MQHSDSILTLKELSLITVVNNIETLRLELVKEQCLPLNIFEELFEITKRMDLIQPSLMEVFIRPESQTLTNLHYFNRNNEITEIISQVCINLKHLSLQSCKDISHYSIIKLIPNIPQIISLNLNNTACSNSALSAISRYCLKLQYLNISNCKRIDNGGMHSLCSNQWRRIINKFLPMKILVLNVINTKITPEGAVHALKNLPLLQTFYYDSYNQILNLLTKELESNASDVIQTYPLTTFCSNQTTKENMETATRVWPNIQKLKIVRINSDILAASRFKNLQVLVIERLIPANSFSILITPLLENIGKNLMHLTLKYVFFVDISAIGITCPLLETLNLDKVSSCDDNNRLQQQSNINTCSHIPFRRLQQLDLIFFKDDFTPKLHLWMLLSNCQYLERLSIQNCQSMTEALLRHVTRKNLFRKLNSLSCYQMNSISMLFLEMLLVLANNLTDVHVVKCKQISNAELHLLAMKFNLEWFYH